MMSGRLFFVGVAYVRYRYHSGVVGRHVEVNGGVDHVERPKSNIEECHPGIRAGDVSLRGAPFTDENIYIS